MGTFLQAQQSIAGTAGPIKVLHSLHVWSGTCEILYGIWTLPPHWLNSHIGHKWKVQATRGILITVCDVSGC